MKQVFKSNIGLVVEDVPIPSVEKGRVLVKVCRSLISTGTETASFRKNGIKESPMKKAIENAQKMHQYIIENGISAAKDKLNQKVNPSKEIEKLQAIGYSCAGIVVEKGDGVQGISIGDRVACAGSGIATHSEYVSVPINLLAKIPDSVSMEAAAFTTVGCISLQGFRRANLGLGEVVVVIGLGL
ncbi:MAG: oxidoreductase, partial [Candidatus Cloacimonetes bacterium]|nr:oxidoreductase [Candidatus Cloacimonadota bacterium]